MGQAVIVEFYRALANRPEALDAFTGFVQTVYRGKSTLHPKHGELAYITATAIERRPGLVRLGLGTRFALTGGHYLVAIARHQ
jgi:hypothetical protein